MATIIRKKSQTPSQLGIKPTKQQKLQHITNKLGLPGISDMQGSSVNIVDTIVLAANTTGRTTLNFFQQTQNKSSNFSNFQAGILTGGESLICEQISFTLLKLSASDLTQDSTNIITMYPLSQDSGNIVNFPAALFSAQMSITIANSQVVKKYQIIESNPCYNPLTSGMTGGDILNGTPAVVDQRGIFGQCAVFMQAPPVLPPNQRIVLSLEIPPIGAITGTMALMCTVGKFGSIFSAKQNL